MQIKLCNQKILRVCKLKKHAIKNPSVTKVAVHLFRYLQFCIVKLKTWKFLDISLLF